MERKKAIYTFAIIYSLVNFLIIALFLLGVLDLTGFIIAFVVAMLISMGIAFVIIRRAK